MKKGDFYWLLALLVWVVMLAIPNSRDAFMTFTTNHAYIGGFIKFSILATMGDMLGSRILRGEWSIPKGVFYKAIVWGIIGMSIALVFSVYPPGVAAAMAAGKIPFANSKLAYAFFTSVILNFTYAPALFAFHRFSDMYIDAKVDKKGGKVTLDELIEKNDWSSLVKFSWLTTCPFFWVPCHTVVFLLPAQYRVLVSAFLSIALGVLMAISKKGKKK